MEKQTKKNKSSPPDNEIPSSHQSVEEDPQNNNTAQDDSVIYLELEDDSHKDLVVRNILKSHIIAAISVSLIPVPFFDFAALTATQINMLKNLCEHYGVAFDETNSKALLVNLIGGSLPVLSVAGLSSLSKVIPGIGSFVGSASLSIIAGATTYAVGQIFNMHFLEGGTLEDFNPKQAQELFKQELKKGKKIIAKMKSNDKQEHL
jgi:uncharacterized protein (DUF697 family)